LCTSGKKDAVSVLVTLDLNPNLQLGMSPNVGVFLASGVDFDVTTSVKWG
jgi:hypothetical protein